MEEIISEIVEQILYSTAEIMLIALAIILAVFLILHIFGAIGLWKIANKRGNKKSWIAIIPIVNIFLVGTLAFKKRIVAYVLLVLTLLSTVYISDLNNVLPPLAIIALLSITFVMYLVSVFKIYKSLSKKYVAMFIFTVLTAGLISPFMLFAIRNNELISND